MDTDELEKNYIEKEYTQIHPQVAKQHLNYLHNIDPENMSKAVRTIIDQQIKQDKREQRERAILLMMVLCILCLAVLQIFIL